MNIYSTTNPPPGYYVYAYLRKNNRTPYYIGKGKDKRAWKKCKRHISKPKNNDYISIIKCNLNEEEAISLEKRLIKFFGRKDLGTGILLNLTDGGEGLSGHIFSSDSREKMSISKLKNPPRLYGEKNWMYGRKGILSPTWGIKRPDLSERNKTNPPAKGKKHRKVECPHCKMITSSKRWHFDRCKDNPFR